MAHRAGLDRYAARLLGLCRRSAVNTGCLAQASSSSQEFLASSATTSAAAGLHSWAFCGSQRQPTTNAGVPHAGVGTAFSAQPCFRGIRTSAASRAKDLYQTLGVAKDASDSDIKKAWYKLAKKYHPDTSKEDGAKEKYHEAQQAYETLSNKQNRATYDQVGADNWERMSSGGGDPGAGFGGFGAQGFSSGFENIFGNMNGEVRFGGAAFDLGDLFNAQYERRMRQMQTEVQLTFMEAAKGVKKSLRISRGLPSPQTVELNIPAGVDSGMVLSAGELDTGKKKPRMELYVTVYVEQHPIFERDGSNVIVHSTLDMVDACLGTEITVPTLDGEKILKVRAGTQSGDRLRLRGLGMTVLGTSQRGDQFIVLKVAVPRNLTQRQRELLEEFAAASGEDRTAKTAD